MKAIVRFLVCLAVLLLAVRECAVVVPWVRDRLRPVPTVTCGSFSRQKLTIAQAWPVIPSLWQWQHVVSRPGDGYFFDPYFPMCRYLEERGCWIPQTSEQHACTPAEIAEWRRKR